MTQKMIRYLGGGAHSDPQTTAKAKEVLNRSLNGQYHFLTLQELNPYKNDLSGKDFVISQNVGAQKVAGYSADKNDITYFNLLTNSGISTPDRSFVGGYYIEPRVDTLTLLGMYYAPYSDFFGQKGLTRDNYFDDVKIGVAVTKLASGKYATSVILHYPKKFWDLVVDD